MAAQDDTITPQSTRTERPNPLLSVTVLNYNYAHYLPQCLDSILSQTFNDFEIILVNDRSTDNSLEVTQPYLADPRVRLVNHEQNKGYIASLIEGSQLSRGKYITVISADDYCVSDRAFASLLQPMQADDEVVMAYAAHGHYGPDSICRYHRQPHPASYVRAGIDEFRDLVLENYVLHSGTIIRTTAYHAVGGYDATARYAPDSIMWLRLCAQGKIAYCADELYAYRVHAQSMSVSTKGIRDGLIEALGGVKRALDEMDGAPGVDHALSVRAIKSNLTAVATDNIFSGHLRIGWYAYWCGLRLHPVWTVLQSRTPILIVRTALGERGFTALHSAMRRARGTRTAPAGDKHTAGDRADHATVCMCTRNRGERIVAALRSLGQSDYQDFDVVIVDQSANSATEEALRSIPELESRLTYIRSDSRGLSHARNIAVEHACGPLIAFTDDDCEVSPEWLGTIISHFGADAAVGQVCGAVVAGPHDATSGFIPDFPVVALERVRGPWRKWRAGGIGANMAFRASALQRVGPFDELLGSGGALFSYEDGDMTYRMLRAGYTVLNVPDAPVVHHGFRTWQEGTVLMRRVGIAIGAACMKHVRLGDPAILPTLLYEWARCISWKRVILLRGHTGVARFIEFGVGLAVSFRHPLDPRWRVYRSVARDQPQLASERLVAASALVQDAAGK